MLRERNMAGARRLSIDPGRSLRAALQAGTSLAVLAAALIASAPASAESLKDTLTATYQGNPKLEAERARLRATDEEVARANAGYRPVVTGQADGGRQMLKTVPADPGYGNTSPYGYQLTVKQPVFQGFKTPNQVASAEAGVRAGRAQLRQTENQVLLEAVTAYADVVRDTAILQLKETNVGVLTKDLEAAETRRSVREVTKTDVAQARARRAKAVSAADLAKANLKVSRAVYERVVGHAPRGLTEPPLKLKQIPRSIEEALNLGEGESPNLTGALYREQAARHSIDVVRSELLPEVHLEASYGRQYDASVGLAEQDTASVTGRVTVPLYEGGEVYARVRQAAHTHVSRLQEIEQARVETQAAIRTAWSRLMAARAQLKSDEVQVEANRIALEGVREEERVGQRTLLDVLNAEQEYLDAQVAMTTTRHDLVVANYALLAAMGQLTAETLGLGDHIYDPEQHYQEVRQQWFGLSIEHADGRRELIRAADADESLEPNE
jgi:outer membrane protein